MARSKDLWWTAGKRGEKHKTARHPDNGGNPSANRYLAEWRDASGHVRTETFPTDRKARQYAEDRESEARRGEYIDPQAGKTPLGNVARKWLRLREVGASSAARYESLYRVHIEPVFGERAVGGIKASEVAAWSRSLAGHPTTRRMALIILTGVLDLAVADRMRRDNPARERVVARPKTQRKRKEDPWDASRVLAVAAACGTHRSIPLVAAGLGLRHGEAFGLAVEDIDAAETVHIRRQLARVTGGWVFKLPKGGKPRDVPLPRGVATLTEGVSAQQITLPWLNEDGTIRDKPERVSLLFHDEERPLWTRVWNRDIWKHALAEAGVIPPFTQPDPVAREHGFHALRHWYSTYLLDNGVSLAAVMEFMGHSRESVPLAIGVYGHVTEQSRETARRAVDAALFGLRPVPSHGTVAELRRA